MIVRQCVYLLLEAASKRKSRHRSRLRLHAPGAISLGEGERERGGERGGEYTPRNDTTVSENGIYIYTFKKPWRCLVSKSNHRNVQCSNHGES